MEEYGIMKYLGLTVTRWEGGGWETGNLLCKEVSHRYML